MKQHQASAEMYPKQFVLTRSNVQMSEGWQVRWLSDWQLATSSIDGVPVIPIVAANLNHIGWLLGHAIDANGSLVEPTLRISSSPDDASFPSEFESWLYSHTGRYAAVLITPRVARLYLDPVGSLSAVYWLEGGCVASSIGLLPERPDSVDRELVEALGIPEKDNWYPFGLTSRRDVRRMLPNHFLDLFAWRTARHWPSQELERSEETEVPSLIELISDRLRHNTEAVVNECHATMNLTAGRDSRMILSAARNVADRLRFVTTQIPDAPGTLDSRVAKRLARDLRLQHVVLPWKDATHDELEEWLQRTGSCVAGRTWRGVRAFRQASAGDVVLLSGLAAEVGRAFYWRRGDEPGQTIAPADLVERLKLPSADEILAACEKWMTRLPTTDLFETLDLCYLENRVGCWAMPQLYGHVFDRCTMFPFNDRIIIDAMMRLPVTYRYEQRMAEDVIKRGWPELLRYPFNRDVGYQELLRLAKGILRSQVRRYPRYLGWIPDRLTY